MKKIKKIEIIIGSIEFKKIVQIFNKHELMFTTMNNVSGVGSTGERSDQEIFGILKNSYLISALEESDWSKIKEEIRIILKTYQGVCIVSDAESFS